MGNKGATQEISIDEDLKAEHIRLVNLVNCSQDGVEENDVANWVKLNNDLLIARNQSHAREC